MTSLYRASRRQKLCHVGHFTTTSCISTAVPKLPDPMPWRWVLLAAGRDVVTGQLQPVSIELGGDFPYHCPIDDHTPTGHEYEAGPALIFPGSHGHELCVRVYNRECKQ